MTREQKIRYFITLNTGGKIMDKKYIDNAEKLLDQLSEEK
jgi:hypothetical protein